MAKNKAPIRTFKKSTMQKILKYTLQLIIIMAISQLGELLNKIIPLPIPASIYGMIILFTALCTGVIKLSAVKECGKFLISIMPLLFVPAAVGLIESWDIMQDFLLATIAIVVVSTILVTALAGHATELIIKHSKKGDKK